MPTGSLNNLTKLKWFKEQDFSRIRTLKHRNHLADIFLSMILWTIHLSEMRGGGGGVEIKKHLFTRCLKLINSSKLHMEPEKSDKKRSKNKI